MFANWNQADELWHQKSRLRQGAQHFYCWMKLCRMHTFCPHKLHNFSLYLINCTTWFFFLLLLLEDQLWCSHEWICSGRRLGPLGGGVRGGCIKIQTSDSDYRQNYNFILKILRLKSWMKRSEFQNAKRKVRSAFYSGPNPDTDRKKQMVLFLFFKKTKKPS